MGRHIPVDHRGRAGASITGAVQAAKVYLVLTSAGNVPREGRVLLDGQPIPNAHAGTDVQDGVVTVTGQRLYNLVSFPNAQQFTFTVQLPPGVSAYDFTSARTIPPPPPRDRADGLVGAASAPVPWSLTRDLESDDGGLNAVRSWLRCYRCWSQNLEVQVHYEGIHRIDPETGERGEVVDEMQEAVVQCLECMHDQPHLGSTTAGSSRSRTAGSG